MPKRAAAFRRTVLQGKKVKSVASRPAAGKAAALWVDGKQVKQARQVARAVIEPIQKQILSRTTVSIERTTLRLLGISGSQMEKEEAHGSIEMPLVNAIVDKIRRAELLDKGALWAIGSLMDKTDRDFETICHEIAGGKWDAELQRCETPPQEATRKLLAARAVGCVRSLRDKAKRKRQRQGKVFGREEPLRYVIVATGNIHEDAVQARAAARNGADIIAVIRSTAQSLLDYVPVGITTVGFGGTFATQENFRLMRQALDETGAELGRYIHLTNYSSGLCMPEIAAMAALEDLDMLLNDAMYGILFRDINMQRTFTDQYFSRLICAASGIYIQTGEDNYLTTANAYEAAHHVLASQLINEQFALCAGIRPERMCLGHAFEMDPQLEDGFLWEVAQAQLIRQVFPEAPLKYMPPTKHKSGDFFWSNLYDGMFNLSGLLTGQTIMLLGMATESLHNPMMHDRFWSLKNANYVFKNFRHLRYALDWRRGGAMEKRSREVLGKALALLRKVKRTGLMESISKGWFADVKRHPEGGKGLSGVIEKGKDYWNPLWDNLERAT